ncbi:hypothetical protein JZ751_005145 [Albula glossodonta]|uniref:Uncharacterized protein n=1 Tax=Albula glossodonta TaxID=121402 RepID=A0A8T2P7C8_9TELE|nr:hypothetical protein JZ751_005145 [Albula glossodonta]
MWDDSTPLGFLQSGKAKVHVYPRSHHPSSQRRLLCSERFIRKRRSVSRETCALPCFLNPHSTLRES